MPLRLHTGVRHALTGGGGGGNMCRIQNLEVQLYRWLKELHRLQCYFLMGFRIDKGKT